MITVAAFRAVGTATSTTTAAMDPTSRAPPAVSRFLTDLIL